MKFIYIVILAFLLFSMIGCDKTPDIEVDNIGLLFLKINNLRLSGCNFGNEYFPPVNKLEKDTSLEKAAEKYAYDMYKYKYFSHIGRDGSTVLQRAIIQGFKGTTAMEDIARGYTTVNSVLEAWKESEPHCRALMDSTMVFIGIGKQGDYWVLDFGN